MLGATRNNGIGKNYSEQAKKNDFFYSICIEYEVRTDSHFNFFLSVKLCEGFQ